MSIALHVMAAFAAAALLCHWLRGVLTRLDVVDRPEARRLHSGTVPRGGGLAIAVVVGVAVAASPLPADQRWSWLLAGAGFALLGAWDDWRSRRPDVRLVLHLAMATTWVMTMPGTVQTLHGLVAAALVFAVVWSINLFNFMDGADGFAATEAMMVALAMAAAFAHAGAATLAEIQLVLAAACAGFLLFNWAPARLFLGDSGSYLLGFQWAAMGWQAWLSGIAPAVPLALVAPFVADASLTLIARAARGERFWLAHRSHAYQRLIVGGWSPRRLVAALVVLNLSVCWPLAWYALRGGVRAWLACALCYGVVISLWYITTVSYPPQGDKPSSTS
ncbi:MAG: glycosyl transferase [Gammaproteobacteria bacterium]